MGKKGAKSFLKAGGKSQVDGEAVEDIQENSVATAPQQVQKSDKAEVAGVSGSDEDDSDQTGPETRGRMLQRHKKEMLAFKKNLQRMGKKSKDDVAKLTKEIEDRHAKELQELETREVAAAVAAAAAAANTSAPQQDAAEAMAKCSVSEDGQEDSASKKPTKAQARRDKKAKQEAERAARIAEELAATGPSQKAEEEEALREMLRPLGLSVVDIRPDGHCLYRALEHQLNLAQRTDYSYMSLRTLAAEHIRQHKDDYAPFIYDTDEEGEADEQLEEYCQTLESTATWGGQLEIGAISAALGLPIKVFAAGLPPVLAGEEYSAEPLNLCYLQYAYGLGAHYNSLIKEPLEQCADSGSEVTVPILEVNA